MATIWLFFWPCHVWGSVRLSSCVCLYLCVCEDNLFEKCLFLPYNSSFSLLKRLMSSHYLILSLRMVTTQQIMKMFYYKTGNLLTHLFTYLQKHTWRVRLSETKKVCCWIWCDIQYETIFNEQQTPLCAALGVWLQHSGFMARQTKAGIQQKSLMIMIILNMHSLQDSNKIEHHRIRFSHQRAMHHLMWSHGEADINKMQLSMV